MNRKMNTLYAAVVVALATPALALSAQAQNPQADAGNARTLDTLIVTGTRVAERTVAQSQSPIDIITPEALTATGSGELATALARALPSLNFPRPALTDGTSGIRPAQLRGLSPDQVLILVNGKRRHSSAQLNVNGSIGRGSSATDLNAIPIAAIERVEVLRDGASAQYGSDAIAGVVNIVLKGAASGGSLAVDAGQYSAGDGNKVQLSGDAGVGFAEGRGSVHVAAQISDQDPSNRAGPYQGSAPHTGNYPGIGEKAFIIGDPQVQATAVSANGQYRFSDAVSGYATAMASNRDITSFAFYRSRNHNALTSLFYPDGFVPQINQDSRDRSLLAGIKGSTEGGLSWDVGYNYGYNKIDFHTRNSVNYSLGANSPRSFYDGALEYTQNVLNADFTQSLELGLAYPAALSFGAEYRQEKWNQSPGAPDSYVGGGAQGFGGFTAENAVHSDRDSYALYAGLEADLSEKFSAGVTARYEDYSDFGDAVSGKLSARYAFTDAVALRATASTGFRAPSLAQQNYQVITSSVDSSGVFTQRGTFPATSQAALALGAEPLKQEESTSYSLGLVLQPTQNLYLTVDAYQIEIDDRIVLSSPLNIDPTASANSGVPARLAAARAAQTLLAGMGINGVTSFNYFTNAIDTRTRGVDVVASYTQPLAASTLELTASYGYSKTEITHIAADPAAWGAFSALSPSRIARDEIGRIEEGYPHNKAILNSTWKGQKWDLGLTATRYGSFTNRPSSGAANDQTFDANWVLDVSASYRPSEQWKLTVGADNVLDQYPDRSLFANSTFGMFPYSNYSPYGFNGAYVYGRIAYTW
jgi:iron complex outermembrane recepter protein